MGPPLYVSLSMNFVFNEEGDGTEENVYPTLPVFFLFTSRQTSTMLSIKLKFYLKFKTRFGPKKINIKRNSAF